MKTKIWFILLALLMLVPCYFSLKAIYHFYFSSYPVEHVYIRNENWIVVGFMALYSMLLVIPYLISYIIFKDKLAKTFVFYTSIPFLLMLLIVIYGTFLGIAW